MRDYELVTMVKPDVDEDGLSETIDKLGKFIGDRGGEVNESDRWKKRKLAYPVKKFMEASYVLTRFKLDAVSVKELELEIRNWEEVLRYLVVKVGN
ncbi:MAG: 30S ribosomal protein S6 [Dehalococcoidia bacterium]|nr:30S ribosomal protein S6 [Dehalococcoidia bacterium]